MGSRNPGSRNSVSKCRGGGWGKWEMSIKKGEEKAGISWGRYVEAPQSQPCLRDNGVRPSVRGVT